MEQIPLVWNLNGTRCNHTCTARNAEDNHVGGGRNKSLGRVSDSGVWSLLSSLFNFFHTLD